MQGYSLDKDVGVHNLGLWFLVLLFGLLSSGCVSFPYRGLLVSQPPRSVSPPQPSLFIPPETAPLRVEEIQDKGDYLLSILSLEPTIRLANEGERVNLYLYQPSHRGPTPPQSLAEPDIWPKKPALILLPITSGEYFTENLAQYFVKRGFVSLRYPSRNELVVLTEKDDALKQFQEILRDDVINVRRGLAWLREQPGIDPERIGIMGISLGAIVASLVTGIDPEIKAAVLFLAGGNLPGILTSSQEKPITQFRIERLNLNDEKDVGLLHQATEVLGPVDPLYYPSLLSPDRILMINGSFDAVIKRRYTEELWQHLGEPTLTYLPTGHYASILYFHYARYKALKHFEDFLSED
jgi:dienelactone hydrolase